MIKKLFFSSQSVPPQILHALCDLSAGAQQRWQTEARSVFLSLFGVEAYMVLTRAAANVLGLDAILDPRQAVICDQRTALQLTASGALELFTGSTVIPIDTDKLRIEQITRVREDVKGAQPRVLSISQPTFYGSVYTKDELKALSEFAHSHGMLVHMEGSFLANAAAFLSCSLKELTVDSGIDVLSFAPSELLAGGAVLFFDEKRGKGFSRIQEQGMQRLPDMSFIEAQFVALGRDSLLFTSAYHANSLAALLASKFESIDDVDVAQVQTHIVCMRLPHKVVTQMQEQCNLEIIDESEGEIRVMTSFATTEQEIDKFVELVTKAIKAL